MELAKVKQKSGWVMKWGVWLSYVWLATLAGLALHPYKSMRKIVLREPIFLPVIISPMIAVGGLWLLGCVGSRVWELGGWVRELVAMGLGVSLIGLSLWQGLLLVLAGRFWRAR